MILSDVDILNRLESGELVVEPLEDLDLQIQPASVDLRLGQEFLEFQRTNISCIHPNSEREVEEYVEETTVEESGEFILHPGDFVLGTTHERVEIPPDLIAHVEGRSSLGRLAVVVHASLPYEEEVFLWTPEEGFGFYEIGAIVENERPARAVAFDPTTLRVSTHRVTDHIRSPTKRIYRVTLDSGREVLVTKDHNLFTLDERGGVTRVPSEDAEGRLVMVPGSLPESPSEEQTLDLLELLDPDETTVYAADGVGAVDWSALPQDAQRFDESQNSAPMTAVRRTDVSDDADVAVKQSDHKTSRTLSITPEFGWVLGFYIANGSAHHKQIQIGTTNNAYLDRFAAFFEEDGVELSWEETDSITKLTVASALWSKLFRELAGAGSEKTVPRQAWNWSDEVLKALLDGLLDGNGCQSGEGETLSTTNPELANRTMYLATRLGQLGSMDRREQERKYPVPMSGVDRSGEMWAVDVSGEQQTREQYIPVPSALLREIREEVGLSLQEAADMMGYSSNASITDVDYEHDDSIKRSTLQQFRDAYADAGGDTTRLTQLLDGDVRFEEVISVEKTDRVEPTYDLEVQPKGRTIENFIGGTGGVFLSNTAGLCDPGFRGRITLELSNLGTAPVALTPGMRISQLTFTELTTRAERPYGTDRGSKYQDQDGPQASRIQGDREFGGEQ